MNSEEQKKFWTANKTSYKADVTSKILLKTHKKFLGQNILDIGAGSGALILETQKMFPQKTITGVDIAPKQAFIKQADCTKLPFPDETFDTVISTDLIEHLNDEDLAKCVKEAKRVLKPGGIGIFATIYNEKLENATTHCPQCGHNFHRWGHIQVFDEKKISEVFKTYTIVSTKKTNLQRHSIFKSLYPLGMGFVCEYLQKHNLLAQSHTDFIVVVRKDGWN